MIRSPLRRAAVVAATAGALLLAVAAPAAAHVTVNPDSASQGGFTKVTFRVPNETDNAVGPGRQTASQPMRDHGPAAAATPRTVHGMPDVAAPS